MPIHNICAITEINDDINLLKKLEVAELASVAKNKGDTHIKQVISKFRTISLIYILHKHTNIIMEIAARGNTGTSHAVKSVNQTSNEEITPSP